MHSGVDYREQPDKDGGGRQRGCKEIESLKPGTGVGVPEKAALDRV